MTACALPVYAVVTPAMGDVLSAIATYARHHDASPTTRELGVILQRSAARVSEHLVKLRLLGLVTWRDRAGRTLRLTGAPWVVCAR